MVQVIGSLLILAAFTASQRGALSQSSRVYLVLNLAGSVVLTVIAVSENQFGFILLEGCWALLSARSLTRQGRGKQHLSRSATESDRSPDPLTNQLSI